MQPLDILVRALGRMSAHLLLLGRAMHSSSVQHCRLQFSNNAQRARHSSQHVRWPTRCSSLAAAAQPVAQIAESGVLTDLLTMTLAGGIIAGVTLSALPLLSGRAQVGCRPCTMEACQMRSTCESLTTAAGCLSGHPRAHATVFR